LAKPNYAFAKRQRDLAKKQKKEAKLKRKADASAPPSPESDEPPAEGETGASDVPGDVRAA
jgi:hypothetical protein